MTTRTKRVAVAAGGLFAAAAVLAPAANAETYTVNSNGDSGDGTCDSTCTLRDAIQTANGHLNDPAGTPDQINFDASVRGTIQLLHGSLDVTNDSVHINGPGADVLDVVATSGDRVYKLFGFGTTPVEDYDVTISGQTISGGSPGSAFGIFNWGGGILSTDRDFDSGCGGDAAALTLNGVHVTGNRADTGAGGGVAVVLTGGCASKAGSPGTHEGDLNVIDSTISGNHSHGQGGGIAMDGFSGSLFVSNSTIADNDADGPGAGISIIPFQPGKVTPATDNVYDVDNSTVTGNDTGATKGGGIYSEAPDVGLRSTIVYGNTSTPPDDPETKATNPSDLGTADTTFTAGYSLIGTRTGAVVNDVSGEPNLSENPQLGALQNNGGPTPTELPATTSPAIDTGISNGLTTDQRGLPRTVDRDPANAADGTEIGAVEIPADPPPPPEQPPDEPTPLPGPAPQFCLGKQVILTKGGDADEKLTGTGTDDGIIAGGGQDLLQGLSGDDCLFGQTGNDKVEGGPGNDNANGDRDDDTVKGDDGDDSVRGQNGDDRVLGGAGNDPKVTGGAGDDTVKGGAGDDFVKGDGGNDSIVPGGGADFVHSGGGADTINAADGEKDHIICGTGKDVANVDPVDDVDKDCNTVNVIAGPHQRLKGW
jgi:CSLREA domain-containing protein